jgi:hypothetical protein
MPSRLDTVISKLSARTTRLNAAEWRQALKAMGEQLYEEISKDGESKSTTLIELNASIKRAKSRTKRKK